MTRALEPGAPSPWLDHATLDYLQVLAEGLTSVVGFGLAAISVVDGDDLVCATVNGSGWAFDGDGHRRHFDELVGTRWPLSGVEADLAGADDWGTFKFLPHHRAEGLQKCAWVPDLDYGGGPDAWHPLDLLLAPIRDSRGDLRALISIDSPLDGLRPGPAKRRMMNRYADQATTAVLAALDRNELSERVRVLGAARSAIRSASANLDLHALLEQTGEALRSGFNADGLWIHTIDNDLDDVAVTDGRPVVPAVRPELVALMEQAATGFWQEQRVNVETREAIATQRPYGDLVDDLLAFFDLHHISSVLFVPLGAGPTCVGALIITRGPGRTSWSQAETDVALGLGHDLGRAIENARSYGRERRLAEDLRQLNAYKSRMITTLSDELVAPIHTMLDAVHRLSALGGHRYREVDAMARGAHRMERLVEDLTVLAQVGDPRTPLERQPVDLLGLVREAAELYGVAGHGLSLRIVHDGGPGYVAGDRVELERVAGNLLGNAVKYTPEGGRVTVSLRSHERRYVELEVTDTGLGISEQDLPRLFEEFFRSADPRARAMPGTGLGLAIVNRIVERHGGRIEVESRLGEGSTFRLHLPAS